ncbi:phospholipid phosphatase-related protein type 4 isoform X2 [Syngnathus typhle]|uniref:phospholipid phosphatase-related protein type 4 isoform X2 n=1 Tax=Syngnathus typhle TaxID=161592 RepID=UPI002A6A3FE2|nr:phospholipid phosphatase-related protein type 4 isoform X2 [Syngnathus typhle]
MSGGLAMSAREKGIQTKDSVSLLPCFYFVELPILVSSMVSLYFLEWTDLFKPVKSGFNCHDRSLSLPYVDPNHEVIPLLMLLSLAFAGPAITIMIGEAILFCCLSRRKSRSGAEANINAAGCNFNSFIRRAIRFIGVHAFGLCATALITDILQLMTGYPAPYFLTVCKPNYTTLNISCEQNPYIMDDICSGVDAVAINRGRKSFPSQHATLASFAAVYVSGLYAVGNFLPSEEQNSTLPSQPHCPTCSLPHISQEAVLHHLQMKASASVEPGLPASQSEGLLHRGLPQQKGDDSLKCSGRDADGLSSHSPRSKETVVTFSHTLPRVHTPQAIAAYEEAARRHAATLHHASMDSSRSKQLLSQWKSKNNHKCTLQVPDCFPPSADLPVQPSQHPHHHGSMEVRSSSEPSAMGLEASFEAHAYLSKLATGASTTLPSNCSGITGGTRMLMQPRPGSSQLVHIPEESHENYHNTSPKAGGEDSLSSVDGTVQGNWQRAAEKTAICRTNDDGKKAQPRIMQVIAMSKQQGLLQTHSKSLDESSTVAGSQSLAHYRALNPDKDPAIVRIEAHPENNKPVIQAPSNDGSGSWRWRSLDHGNGAVVGQGSAGSGSLRQSFDLNDLNRDSESSDSVREGSIDRKRTYTTSQKLHNQSLSTIRVTPGDVSGAGSGDTASEIPSVASSRESTLRRKGHNVILIPERGSSPDITRNVFYKGASIPNKE